MSGRLIVLEGTDGSGKATQSRMLQRKLMNAGYSTARFFFPQYGRNMFANLVGAYLRKEYGDLDPHLAAMLYAGDRFHVAPKIRKALGQGRIIVSDRYAGSSKAHQTARMPEAGREEFLKWLDNLEFKEFKIPRPDLTVFLQVDPKVSYELIASKKEHEIITTNADELLKINKDIPKQIKKKDTNLDLDQKAYIKKELDKSQIICLETNGFKEVHQVGISGKKEVYLVIDDKKESPGHIICIKEIMDYLKSFTQDVSTFRSVKPDIVFKANEKEYAIEVETGKINNLKQLKEKVENLKKYYGENWFFFVVDRNLRKYYEKFGTTYSKRNIKLKIDKIFKNSKK